MDLPAQLARQAHRIGPQKTPEVARAQRPSKHFRRVDLMKRRCGRGLGVVAAGLKALLEQAAAIANDRPAPNLGLLALRDGKARGIRREGYFEGRQGKGACSGCKNGLRTRGDIFKCAPGGRG